MWVLICKTSEDTTSCIDSQLVVCSTAFSFILLSPLSFLCFLTFPIFLPFLPLLSSPTSHFLLLSPFTDAIVVINCTKEDYDGIRHDDFYEDWSKDQALELTVGDVITDVKLVCSSQWIVTTIHRAMCYFSSKVALCIIVECCTEHTTVGYE